MTMSFAVPLILAAGLAAWAQDLPRVTTVNPPNGRAGDVISVAGENLAKTHVAKVFLTDEKNDIVVQVTEQTPTSLKFIIPAKASPGRFAVMVQTTGKQPKLIEEPVKLTVEQ
jgi:IPT/TIG domain